MVNNDLLDDIINMEVALKNCKNEESIKTLQTQLRAKTLEYFGKMTGSESKNIENLEKAFMVFTYISHNSSFILKKVPPFRNMLNWYLKEKYEDNKHDRTLYKNVNHILCKNKIYDWTLRENKDIPMMKECNAFQRVVNHIGFDNEKDKYDYYVDTLRHIGVNSDSFVVKSNEFLLKDRNRNKEDLSVMYSGLREFLDYFTLQNNKARESKEKTRYSRAVKEFIKGKYKDKNEFCRLNALSFDKFEECLSKFVTKTKEENEYDEVVANSIVGFIMNGIEDDKGVRDFDSIDYYTITKSPMINLVRYVQKGNYSSEEKVAVSAFKSKNDGEKLRDKDIESKFNIKVIYGFKRDNNGRIIEKTGKVLGNDEKLAIFDYLRENSIPITETTYRDGCRRYECGRLFKEEKGKEKKLS